MSQRKPYPNLKNTLNTQLKTTIPSEIYSEKAGVSVAYARYKLVPSIRESTCNTMDKTRQPSVTLFLLMTTAIVDNNKYISKIRLLFPAFC